MEIKDDYIDYMDNIKKNLIYSYFVIKFISEKLHSPPFLDEEMKELYNEEQK